MSGDPRAEAFRALAQFLVSECSIRETLQRISDVTVVALPCAHTVGLTMLDERGKVSTAVFTDVEAVEVDAAQYETGRGPCLDAWRTRKIVRIDDMAAAVDGVYAKFAASCLEHGILSTLSLPLAVGDQGVGAMNLYAHRTDGFSAEDESLGTDLAAAMSAVLSNAAAYWQTYELGVNLNEAMQSRAFIEQAKGMLMSQSATLNADGAFAMLRAASQRENIKVRDIAQRILNRERPAGDY
jgi:GAF domain-containing protein